jgi:hypothetical protein
MSVHRFKTVLLSNFPVLYIKFVVIFKERKLSHSVEFDTILRFISWGVIMDFVSIPLLFLFVFVLCVSCLLSLVMCVFTLCYFSSRPNNIFNSRQCSRPAKLTRHDGLGKTYRSCQKHKSLSLHDILSTCRHLLAVSFTVKLKSNLCTALTK